jgi:thiol-disulfide isomerase/thioredoxin
VVTVHLSGYAPELRIVEIHAGKTTDLEITLQEARSIEGVVKSETGQPAADAEVAAVSWRGHATLGLRAMTDKDGRFRIENAPADAFEVAVRGPDRESVRQTVQAGQGSPIEIRLPGAPALAEKKKGPLPIGTDVPAIVVKTLSGESLNFTDLKGKTVLLDFWATWCPPCVEELPHFVRVHEKYGARKDFLIVGISKDKDVEDVREHLRRNPRQVWPQVVGTAAGVKEASDAFGVTAVPVVFLIDKDGKITANSLRGEQIEQAVDEAMKGAAP